MMALLTAVFGAKLTRISWRTIFVGVAVLALVAILWLSYWHYSGILEDNARLRERQAELQAQVDAQDLTILTQQGAIREWQEHSADLVRRMGELAEVTRSAEAETRRLSEQFAEQELEKSARREPGAAEARVNAAADRARCLLERASGADRKAC